MFTIEVDGVDLNSKHKYCCIHSLSSEAAERMNTSLSSSDRLVCTIFIVECAALNNEDCIVTIIVVECCALNNNDSNN